jgi:hypothetical protein
MSQLDADRRTLEARFKWMKYAIFFPEKYGMSTKDYRDTEIESYKECLEDLGLIKINK